MKIRIATRKSELALWQARHVADRLSALPGVAGIELVPLSTRGDEILDRSLQKIGGKGLFIKELEVAMQAGAADIAVHSMKDVPAELPQGFCIAALLERANPADALLAHAGGGLDDLPPGALVGSSSLRRQAQLMACRPDLEVRPLRGNVNTRLRKLADREYQAIILACAGLERLGLQGQISAVLRPDQMLPAAAQGVIGIECLEARDDLREVLASLEHLPTKITTLAERAVAARLQADCQSPVASFASIANDVLTLDALVALPDGSRILREQANGSLDDAANIGRAVAEMLLAKGASNMLQKASA